MAVKIELETKENNDSTPVIGEDSVRKVDYDKLTCKDCLRRNICEYVDDPYNTDGDCLWLK